MEWYADNLDDSSRQAWLLDQYLEMMYRKKSLSQDEGDDWDDPADEQSYGPSKAQLQDEVHQLLWSNGKLNATVRKLSCMADDLTEEICSLKGKLEKADKQNAKLKKDLERTPTEENALLMAENKRVREQNAQLRAEMRKLRDEVQKERDELRQQRSALQSLPRQAKYHLDEMQRILRRIPTEPPEQTVQSQDQLQGRDWQLAQDISTSMSGGKAEPPKQDPIPAKDPNACTLEID